MTRRLARIPKPSLTHVRKPQSWLRDRDHLDWVATLPCLACGRRGCSIAAHVRLHNAGAGGRKPSDDRAVPLCGLPKCYDGCHEIQHGLNMSEALFWAQLMERGVSDPWGVAQRLWRISGDTERGYLTIAHARPGLPTAWLN